MCEAIVIMCFQMSLRRQSSGDYRQFSPKCCQESLSDSLSLFPRLDMKHIKMQCFWTHVLRCRTLFWLHWQVVCMHRLWFSLSHTFSLWLWGVHTFFRRRVSGCPMPETCHDFACWSFCYCLTSKCFASMFFFVSLGANSKNILCQS